MEKTSLREWSDGAFVNGASPRGESWTPGRGGAFRPVRPALRLAPPQAPGEEEGGAGLSGRFAAAPGRNAATPQGAAASSPERLAAYLRAIDL